MITYEAGSQCLHLSRELTFSSVPLFWRQIRLLLRNQDISVISLKQVYKVDSAGIALLLACIKEAKELNKPLALEGLSESLLAYAKACHVDNLLRASQ